MQAKNFDPAFPRLPILLALFDAEKTSATEITVMIDGPVVVNGPEGFTAQDNITFQSYEPTAAEYLEDGRVKFIFESLPAGATVFVTGQYPSGVRGATGGYVAPSKVVVHAPLGLQAKSSPEMTGDNTQAIGESPISESGGQEEAKQPKSGNRRG